MMNHITSLEDFRKEMENESTEYLKRIWEVHNLDIWSEYQLNVVSEVLLARGVNLPKPALPDSALLEKVLLATTHILEGKIIKRYIGVVSSEVVLGTGFLSE